MKKPNIVMILIDDMGWRDLACTGSTFYETPNIDRLAKEGMLFTDAYAACPVCSPTRASLMTGKYPARVGVTNWINWTADGFPGGKLCDVPYVDHLPESEYTLPQALKAGGYQTWHFGKWHVGDGDQLTKSHGFDINFGGSHVGSPGNGYFAPWKLPNLEGYDVPEGTYLDDYITDHAIDTLKTKGQDKPFYLNMWFYLVHTPLNAPDELIKKYEAKAKRLHLDETDGLIEGENFPVEHKKHLKVLRRTVQSHPTYAGMIEKLDYNVGRLLDTLDDMGIADNTLVVFTSDNGGLATAEGSPTSNLPLREGKGWMEEGGVREPMMVRWPGIVAPSTVSNQYITTPDLYPTFLDAAELDRIPEQHLDGMSFMPVLKGGEIDRGAIYWHYPHYANQGSTPGCSIREGKWKLIQLFERPDELELYDLDRDISENNNLANVYTDVTERLYNKLVLWRDEEIKGRIPQPNPNWNPYD